MGLQVELPLTPEAARQLHAGDEVELSGSVYTGRDQACARMVQMLQHGATLPVDLAGQLIYFVGPSPARPGQVVGSAGPTTSDRMNRYMPALLERGLRGFIGKGYLDRMVKETLVRYRGVYFGAIGRTGALLSLSIEEAKVIAFPELLSEAIHQMKLSQFPVVVLNDSHGGDLYAKVSAQAT
ncbi:MAG: TRZ/ATZ family protein [Acidimicrobiia bacterium]|nr:TRZ/ATZ family protein [Acidimicrobiia bacterium]